MMTNYNFNNNNIETTAYSSPQQLNNIIPTITTTTTTATSENENDYELVS
jgi:hypothetical protein